ARGIDARGDLSGRVVAGAEAAAGATGATLAVSQPDDVYEPLKRNQTLLDIFDANMRTVGLAEGPAIPDRLGSSDVGNVSQVIPAIQPMIGIAPLGMAIHTREFAEAAVQPLARGAMLAPAKRMAMPTYDVLADQVGGRAAKDESARS